jgi:hypothetical protein
MNNPDGWLLKWDGLSDSTLERFLSSCRGDAQYLKLFQCTIQTKDEGESPALKDFIEQYTRVFSDDSDLRGCFPNADTDAESNCSAGKCVQRPDKSPHRTELDSIRERT